MSQFISIISRKLESNAIIEILVRNGLIKYTLQKKKMKFKDFFRKYDQTYRFGHIY